MSNCHDAIYGALLQEYNVARVRKVNQERSARIAALQTRADAEAYVAEVRAKIAASFAMPERSALPPVTVTGVVETEEYRIEKTIFESRPAFPVTSHLYIPKNLSGKAPAVLFLCGHSQDGKNCDAYRSGAATLAKNGFVVLVVDPVSQGERYQFPDKTNAANIAGLTSTGTVSATTTSGTTTITISGLDNADIGTAINSIVGGTGTGCSGTSCTLTTSGGSLQKGSSAS